jgi:glycosyltransferase involved in cell wall biosynthesis
MIKKSHLDNNKNPLVSIIIPVFNTGKYPAECLNSVIIQTKNIEIICINDGSLDNSQNILDKYKKIDKRILVFNQTNQLTYIRGKDRIEIIKGLDVVNIITNQIEKL